MTLLEFVDIFTTGKHQPIGGMMEKPEGGTEVSRQEKPKKPKKAWKVAKPREMTDETKARIESFISFILGMAARPNSGSEGKRDFSFSITGFTFRIKRYEVETTLLTEISILYHPGRDLPMKGSSQAKPVAEIRFEGLTFTEGQEWERNWAPSKVFIDHTGWQDALKAIRAEEIKKQEDKTIPIRPVLTRSKTA